LVIREYYETVHIAGDHSKIPHYVAADQVRHERGVRDGLAAFEPDLEELTKNRTIDEIRFLFGQGDSSSSLPGERMKAALACTSTCTGSRTKRSLSTGDSRKRFHHKSNGETTTGCSRSDPPVFCAVDQGEIRDTIRIPLKLLQ
jgi:hypothetical protein